MLRCYRYCIISLAVLVTALISEVSYAAPSQKEVLTAMRRATEFMVNTVSCHGGYVWSYNADLTKQWGEAPARPTQIWVQGGTPEMGMMFLDVYEATNDEYYLQCAEKAANALIYGQHPLGGWHYFIDFDITGLEQWYKDIFSNFKWGMEEYRHYYGNCTFDDEATVSPTRFLMKLYMTTLSPEYYIPLVKALDFILMSQYPNGGWPQRYPLRYEFAHDGLPDYTSLYTFNDGVIPNNIDVLVEAYEQLGNEEYLKAAKRGMDFIIIAQGSEGQAAWGDQHGMDLKPAWGRTHEHAGYMPRYTQASIRALQKYYLVTGDGRYLKPIPGSIDWLEKSTIEVLDNGLHKFAIKYEIGTNLPIYIHRTDKVNKEGFGLWRYDHKPPETDAHGSGFTTINLKSLIREYERVSSLTPGEAVAEYEAKKAAKPSIPKVNPDRVDELIESVDKRGAWVEDVSVYGMDISKEYPPGVKFDNSAGTGHASTIIKGISTRNFISNMYTFINYLKSSR